MYYAGIGSRDTPEHIGLIMTALASELGKQGYILRSGAARGADTFFEIGTQDPSQKQVFIHCERLRDGRCHDTQKGYFNAQRYIDYAQAVNIASEVHPAWHRCDRTAQEMHARNVYQVLGPELKPATYSKFLVCWAIPDIHGVPEGGTRTAWKIAARYGIPRFNLAVQSDRQRIVNWLERRLAAREPIQGATAQFKQD